MTIGAQCLNGSQKKDLIVSKSNIVTHRVLPVRSLWVKCKLNPSKSQESTVQLGWSLEAESRGGSGLGPGAQSGH